MSQIVHQIHDKFKSFKGSDVAAISGQISEFVKSSGVAAKSIGIAHVDSASELLISLGYRDDEPGYPIQMTSVNLGHVDTIHASGLQHLDIALAEAASSIEGIICHELVVAPSGDFIAVFMAHIGS